MKMRCLNISELRCQQKCGIVQEASRLGYGRGLSPSVVARNPLRCTRLSDRRTGKPLAAGPDNKPISVLVEESDAVNANAYTAENVEETVVLQSSSQDQRVSTAALPAAAERIASVSASFMVAYCFLPFPGSVYAGLAWRDDIVRLAWEVLHLDSIASSSLMLKYSIAGQVPALLHVLPGAIWCALLPGQLAQAAGRVPGHAVRGRVMLTAAAVLMLGYAFIDTNGLTAEDYDFGGESGLIAEIIDRTEIMQQLGTTFDHLGLKFLAAWFVLTGAMTAVSGKASDFSAHRAWAVRHVGAGVWIAAQRPLFAAIRLGQLAFLRPDTAGSDAAQADAFYIAAYIVTFLYFAGAEAVAQGIWTADNMHNGSEKGGQP